MRYLGAKAVMATTRIDGLEDDRRAAIHYGMLFAIYSIYGYQVCPFLDQLNWSQLLAPVFVALLVQFACRRVLRLWSARLDLIPHMRLLFWSDFGFFIAGGVALAFFNLFAHGFPLDSGAKILVAFMAIGFYIALDLALERERKVIQALRLSGEHLPIETGFLPFRRKFASFSSINLIVVAAIVGLLVSKDLHWIVAEQPDTQMAAFVIMGELCFVIGVVGAYILLVIRKYSANLDQRLQVQNEALRQVEKGRLDAMVPVTSNDEFGQMAQLTNGMVRHLRRTRIALEQTQDVTLMSLISLAAKRDNETGLHLRRTQTYVSMLANSLRVLPGKDHTISDELIGLLFKSAPLHDIGKVGVPDAILKKPGKLTDDEFVIMKTHAQIGADALADAAANLGDSSFLSLAREIALTHHEKWDGTGYPNGLAGTAIPLSGRLMALADVYDALRSPRVYKPAFSHEKAKSIILEGRGSHFDPDIVDAFLMIERDIERLSYDLSDETDLAEKKESGDNEVDIVAA